MHPSRLTRDPEERLFLAWPAVLRHARRSDHRHSDQCRRNVPDRNLDRSHQHRHLGHHRLRSATTSITGASDKSDANWTVLEDVWTTGSGSLQYTLTGLTDGTQYDLQVRAVNSVGDGAWSITGTTASAGDPLVNRYDADGDNMIDKAEVINAINDYLFGEGDEAISKAEVIELINLYLFGPT